MANRRKQISAIQTKAYELAEEVNTLVDELQEAYDNTPESLQDSERGEKMQERIEMLEDWRGQLTDIAEAENE